MIEPRTIFINTGLDDYLAKSFNTSGLVQVLTTVQGKHGTYQRMQWVRPQEAATILDNQFISREVSKLDGKPCSPVYIPFSSMGDANPVPCTAEDVLQHYKKSHSSLNLTEFTKKNYYISDGINITRDAYKRNGKYNSKRWELHKKIVEGIVQQADKAKPGEKPICILLGGGSASGKSTIRDRAIQPELDSKGTRVATVDCDEVKKSIPEYAVFQSQRPKAAAMRVHDESADIVDEAIYRLITEHRHFIYDGTMRSPKRYSSIIKHLRDNGYEVRIVAATVPVETAIQRSDERAEVTHRKVPHDVIRFTHGKCSLTYPQLLPLVDKYELWDNSGPEPVLVQDTEGVKNPQLYNDFIKKGTDWEKDNSHRR